MWSGGGDKLPGRDVTQACVRKSCASCPSYEYELDDLAEGGKSSKDVRNEEREVIRLMPYKLGRFRSLVGPGSLSTVAKEMEDIRLILCTSEDDIE